MHQSGVESNTRRVVVTSKAYAADYGAGAGGSAATGWACASCNGDRSGRGARGGALPSSLSSCKLGVEADNFIDGAGGRGGGGADFGGGEGDYYDGEGVGARNRTFTFGAGRGSRGGKNCGGSRRTRAEYTPDRGGGAQP